MLSARIFRLVGLSATVMVADLPSTGFANSCENLGGGVGDGDDDCDSVVSGACSPEHAESKTSMHAISVASSVQGVLVFLVASIVVPPKSGLSQSSERHESQYGTNYPYMYPCLKLSRTRLPVFAQHGSDPGTRTSRARKPHQEFPLRNVNPLRR